MNPGSGLPISSASVGSRPFPLHALFVVVVIALLPGIAAAQAAAHRQQGPCDIYAAAHTPCVAAHSTTRALYASYNGPLYQLKRASDSKTLDIGIVQPMSSVAGGYANAAVQDSFCANTVCVINRIYDQSGNGNDLLQAAPGTFKGPAPGGFDTQPIADMAPITIDGHKAYGIFIMPGMGLRNNNAKGIAVNDEPEGIYYVVDGTHFDSGCCFDYGNSSTNGRAVGTGTMETTYFGTSTAWGRGDGPGPWIMSDMEAGLFSGYDAKQNTADPTVASWRFVTAVVDGGGGDRWDLRGGNAQSGELTTIYSGKRPAAKRSGGYFPMDKQGGILLGTGGDNGNGSAGTFYEGVITSGYPTIATTDAVQANVVAARYDVARLELSRVTTFTPRSSQQVSLTFTNTTGAPATRVRLALSGPKPQWTAVVADTKQTSKMFEEAIAPGAIVSTTFTLTSSATTGAGYLTGKVEWQNATDHALHMETTAARVRNVQPVKINEVGFGAGDNPEHQFIKLYNASSEVVDLSHWALVGTASQWSPVRLAMIPAGTKLEAHGFYLLGLSDSGLAAPAVAGTKTIYVRNLDGLATGEKINVDGEIRVVESVGTPAAARTTLFIPVSTGPWLRFAPGKNNLPVARASDFAVGQRMGIGLGGKYEQVTVTNVGKGATQTVLAGPASAGATNIKLLADSDVSIGDTLIIGTGTRQETVKVAAVGTDGAAGAGVELTAPLRLDHASGVDVSGVGTGISFSPATRFPHISADAVQPLGSGITLDRPLTRNHSFGAPVTGRPDSKAAREGALPRQWFGEPLSPRAGSLALLDASGTTVVDAIVYGSKQSNSSGNGTIASPELATLKGEQGGGGCIVAVPRPASKTEVSVRRSPDGADTDMNCKDFRVQAIGDQTSTPGTPDKQ
jgi:hypothetical protein